MLPFSRGGQELANGPDWPLVSWLFEGAPAGIHKQPQSVGIFPPSVVAPTQEFDLAYATGESDFNYISFEDSPHTVEVLDELVRSGYVVRCRGLQEARAYLRGEHPVMTKGALITKVKEGVTKHRLILDCRVSGANSQTHKWEKARPSQSVGCRPRHHAP